MLEAIRTLSTIFGELKMGGVLCETHSKWAAEYYVFLISYFPTNIQDMITKASKEPSLKKYTINRDNLLTGRDHLLAHGFIAQVLTHNAQKTYLFRWDKIPGNDNSRLIGFIIQKFGIDWLKPAKKTTKKDNKKEEKIDWLNPAKIEKIDNGKTIHVSTDKNSLSLKLNNEKNKVILEINNNITDEFVAKEENGSLNIYQDNKSSTPLDLGNESYLPINPNIIWNEYKGFIQDFENERRKRIRELAEVFKINFQHHGCAGDIGSLTMLYSSRWLTFTILNNLLYNENNKNLDLMLSGLRSFDQNRIKWYEKMLTPKRGLNIRALFDPHPYTDDPDKLKKFTDRLEMAKNLMNIPKYKDRIQIRHPLITHATSRRMIFNDIAIDARKLLPFGRDEPSFIGTVYLEKTDIEFLQKNFNTAWMSSKL